MVQNVVSFNLINLLQADLEYLGFNMVPNYSAYYDFASGRIFLRFSAAYYIIFKTWNLLRSSFGACPIGPFFQHLSIFYLLYNLYLSSLSFIQLALSRRYASAV